MNENIKVPAAPVNLASQRRLRIVLSAVLLLLGGVLGSLLCVLSGPAVEAEVKIASSGLVVINREHLPWRRVSVCVNGATPWTAYTFRLPRLVPAGETNVIAWSALTLRGQRFDQAGQEITEVCLLVHGHRWSRYEVANFTGAQNRIASTRIDP